MVSLCCLVPLSFIASCPVCCLEVKATNARAIALYSKLGFKQVGLRKGYYDDGTDAILMELNSS